MVSVFLVIIILIIIGAAIFIIAAICNSDNAEKDEERDEAEIGGLITSNVTFNTPSTIIPEMELRDPPYPLTDPEGMPAPPQGYLTSNIPISTVTLSDIPSTRTTTRRVLEEDTTNFSDLPPSYSEVMQNT